MLSANGLMLFHPKLSQRLKKSEKSPYIILKSSLIALKS